MPMEIVRAIFVFRDVFILLFEPSLLIWGLKVIIYSAEHILVGGNTLYVLVIVNISRAMKS